MGLPLKFSDLPMRLAAGAFILNSGLAKRGADEGTVAWLHETAQNAFPFLSEIEREKFVTYLSAAEIALGSALVAPIVPSKLAGLGLTAFGGALTYMYWRNEAWHKEGSPAPTAEGTGYAKDVFLLGIGLSLLLARRGKKH